MNNDREITTDRDMINLDCILLIYNIKCVVHSNLITTSRCCSDTKLPLSNRSRLLSIREKIGDYFNGDSDSTVFAVNVNKF